jgi:hypothetical protein
MLCPAPRWLGSQAQFKLLSVHGWPVTPIVRATGQGRLYVRVRVMVLGPRTELIRSRRGALGDRLQGHGRYDR